MICTILIDLGFLVNSQSFAILKFHYLIFKMKLSFKSFIFRFWWMMTINIGALWSSQLFGGKGNFQTLPVGYYFLTFCTITISLACCLIFSKNIKKIIKGTTELVQKVGHVSCMWQTWIQSLAFNMAPWALDAGVNPTHHCYN